MTFKIFAFRFDLLLCYYLAVYLQATPTINTAVKTGSYRTNGNTTSTDQDKEQSKRQHLVTPHTINMGVELVVIRQTLMAQPHLMINTEEKQAHSKPIPQAEQPNTTATVEKSEVLNSLL